jgi:hypothetical protein
VYVHSKDTFILQLHNHTSLPIRPDQPCNSCKSQLSAGFLSSVSSTVPCTYIAYTWSYCVYTCTYVVHGYYILYAYTTTVHATICTALVIWMYYAICSHHTGISHSVQRGFRQGHTTQEWQSTIKLFVWAGISIKLLAHKNNWRNELCQRICKVLPSILGKGWHFMLSSVSGCRILNDILLLEYFCISKSVGHHNMWHQVSLTGCDFYST